MKMENKNLYGAFLVNHAGEVVLGYKKFPLGSTITLHKHEPAKDVHYTIDSAINAFKHFHFDQDMIDRDKLSAAVYEVSVGVDTRFGAACGTSKSLSPKIMVQPLSIIEGRVHDPRR
jgi:hypothetical protein